MSRDYAKKRKRGRPRRRRKKSHVGLWIFTVLFCALFVWGLIYLAQHHGQKTVAGPAAAPVVTAPTKAPAKKTLPQPKFDFYTLLPKATVETDAASGETAAQGPRYILQVASVQSQEDADHLKAELALLGFASQVEETKAAEGIWYRVTIGPYSTKDAAQADQSRLKENQIDSLLKKVAVPG